MSNKHNIDLEIIEDHGRNTIDSILSKVERLHLKSNLGEIREKIIRELLIVEAVLQDMADDTEDVFKNVIFETFSVLDGINENFSKSISASSIEEVLVHISQTNSVLYNIKHLNFIDYEQDEIYIKRDLALRDNGLSDALNKIKGVRRVVNGEISGKIYKIKDSLVTKLYSFRKRLNRKFYKKPKYKSLLIDIKIKDQRGIKNESFKFWLLLEILSQVKNTDIQLKSINKGSLKSKIVLLFKDSEAEGETYQLIEQIKHAVSEKQKTTTKNELLTDIYEVDIDSEFMDAEIETIKLRNDRLRLENERLKLENEREKIINEREKLKNERMNFELLTDKTRVLTSMMADEIIRSKQFILMFNGKAHINYNED